MAAATACVLARFSGSPEQPTMAKLILPEDRMRWYSSGSTALNSSGGWLAGGCFTWVMSVHTPCSAHEVGSAGWPPFLAAFFAAVLAAVPVGAAVAACFLCFFAEASCLSAFAALSFLWPCLCFLSLSSFL